MRTRLVAASIAALFAGTAIASAQDTTGATPEKPTASATKGAVAGGVAGHMMGHHTKTGMVAGAAVGHHMRKKQEKAASQG